MLYTHENVDAKDIGSEEAELCNIIEVPKSCLACTKTLLQQACHKHHTPQKLQFTINYKITSKDSLNKIYAGVHWTSRKNYSDSIRIIVKNALNSAALTNNAAITKGEAGVIFMRPVHITITYPFGKLDIDNHAYFSKCVVDSLKDVVIKDDTPKHVVGITQRFGERENILVEVEQCFA